MSQPASVVLFRASRDLCALPIENVVEVLRPRPVSPLSGAPPYITGVSLIRGAPMPIVSLERLLGLTHDVPAQRLLVVRLGQHHAALAVSAVLGVERMDTHTISLLPPLVGAKRAAVHGIATRERELLYVLDAGRVIPEDLWATFPEEGRPA